MALMTVVYRTPADPEAFRRHYHDVHVPLARALPGLRSYEVTDGAVTTVSGDREVFMTAVLRFDDMAALRAAFASDAGRACAADRQRLAPGADGVLMTVAESITITAGDAIPAPVPAGSAS